ncbi:lipoate--protein ligase family protein [Terrihalobacillus insolitus]|uniref:lipoate--protein ligase family protein n=1 Tax=Terrihalobacillus insolitus TaxID=2950438 RepID=UPI002341812F|nr:lipoate--protein ligase family protein [Terrihalobacillus insolitus]MDC3414968.1 lipoate--protein ligase family protein [Terrihalobacillus insolitus]
MDKWNHFFKHHTFRIIDHTTSKVGSEEMDVIATDRPTSPAKQKESTDPLSIPPAMESFAIDDALTISVGETISPPTARLWVYEKTIVLGIPDARLPYIERGLSWLKKQGYGAIVRNSGGLAVLLDTGVLNLSFVLPDAKQIDIHSGYEAMVWFIKELFADITKEIEVGEVRGSYCPGDYDLSLKGLKFAGISQRRVKNGSAVQIYLCVEGSGSSRAALIRDFYAVGLGDQIGTTRFEYPEVVPDTMASLSELLSTEITVGEVVERVKKSLDRLCNGTYTQDELIEEELAWYQKRYALMVERNEKILG